MLTFTIILIILFTLYLYGTKRYKYWENRGVKYNKPVPFFGNSIQGFLLLKSMTQMADEIYWKYPNEKVVGFYRGARPVLIVRDPETVKRILITDFQYFYRRGLNSHKKIKGPLTSNLIVADGDIWKLLRKRITPAFTSGKLKSMFPLIAERAARLKTHVLNAAVDGRPLDAKELMARCATDFISAWAFGLDADSLNDEHSEFRKLGVKIFEVKTSYMISEILKSFLPALLRNMMVSLELHGKFKAFVLEALKQRDYHISGRGDLLDVLLECKNKGRIVGESLERVKEDGTPETASLEIDEDVIIAQVFVFFAAGFETSSTAMSHVLHQLAYHPEVQKKAQEEIDRVLAKHGNELCYDSIREMSYLEMVLKEGLRMFPSLGFLIRESTHRYTFPNLDLTIDEGVKVLIPLQAMHNDPKYFDNPELFRPERFLPSEFNSENKYVYLPFGEGPRACIGTRLGMMQSLAGLAAVLSGLSVEPALTTRRRLKIDPRAYLVQSTKGGLPLVFTHRK